MTQNIDHSTLIAPPNAEQFNRICQILHREAGIVLAPGKNSMVQARLAKRMRAMGIYDFDAYLTRVERSGEQEEKQHFISALTTNVSHFFRENHHFDTLRKSILPKLIDSAKAGKRVQIWSAGCSNGQEPYSIAMTILSYAPDADKLGIRIIGTDIDRNVLAYAQRGEYSVAEAAGLSEGMRRSYTVTKEGRVAMSDQVRKLVSFQQLNLHKPWPGMSKYDVIFCRNVVIYFDQDAQSELWQRFEQALNPGGWIFVGHSERIPKHPNSQLSTAGITAYCKQ